MKPISEVRLQKILRRQKLMGEEVLMYQKVMEGIRKGVELDGLLKLIIQAVRKGLGFKRAGIFLVEPDGTHIRLAMGVGKNGNYEKNKDYLPLTPRKGVTIFSDLIFGHKKYFLSNNIPKRIPKEQAYRVQVHNNAVVPIQIGKGRALGALAVDNLDVNRPILKADVWSLLTFATQIGLAIDSMRAHEKILSLSMADPLTGLYNRRFFDQALDHEIKRCQRYERSFCLLLIDIDHFKKINDTFGHGAGDSVLRQLADMLKTHIRSLDCVARVGGEEFAVILPETPPRNVAIVVKRLFREVRQMKPAVAEMAKAGLGITFSMGLAAYRGGNLTPTALMKLADGSLYHAKKTGRDRWGPLRISPSGQKKII